MHMYMKKKSTFLGVISTYYVYLVDLCTLVNVSAWRSDIWWHTQLLSCFRLLNQIIAGKEDFTGSYILCQTMARYARKIAIVRPVLLITFPGT